MVTKAKILAECPSCGEKVFFVRTPRLGQYVDCQYCEEELEVIDLEPILLDFPLDEGDYDDGFDIDDDDEW